MPTLDIAIKELIGLGVYFGITWYLARTTVKAELKSIKDEQKESEDRLRHEIGDLETKYRILRSQVIINRSIIGKAATAADILDRMNEDEQTNEQ